MNGEVYEVLIIGAGASGLLCARECARRAKRTLVLEKEQGPGRKILVSGNGRCNLTNTQVAPGYYHAAPGFMAGVLAQFSYQKCRDYFEQLGVLLREEAQGRIFPACGKSTAVAESLKLAAQEAGAQILTGQEAVQIRRCGSLFQVQTQNGQTCQARHLVLACGSCAYPQAGGTPRGYELARAVGHTVIAPRPTLSGLCLKENFSRLAGIRAQVKLQVQQPSIQTEGEIIFTSYGINGPAALNASSVLSRTLENGPAPIYLNFLPQHPDACAFFAERLTRFAHRRPKDFFAGVLHESLTNLLIDFKGMHKNKPMGNQPENTLKSAFQTVGKWPATVTALRPWNEAMAAAGGVKLSEINYNTFESLRCPGLYITGELLDVHGQSGGFNLHFAWASGFIAARHLSGEE